MAVRSDPPRHLARRDARLVRRAAADPERFGGLYERHRDVVFGRCLRMLKSPADADDATQQTFLKAFVALRAGTVPERTAPWLATIARHVCLDRLAATRRHADVGYDDDFDVPDDGPELDAALLAESEAALIRSGMSRLPYSQRSALYLREVEGLTYAEVGELLGQPVSAVETVIFRARRNLRDEVDAARRPVDCAQARRVAARARAGDDVDLVDRKALRNHRDACAACAELPMRRGARLAVVAAWAFAAAATLRKLVWVPAASAVAAAPTAVQVTVAAVALSGAAGGTAVVVTHLDAPRAATPSVMAPAPERAVRPPSSTDPATLAPAAPVGGRPARPASRTPGRRRAAGRPTVTRRRAPGRATPKGSARPPRARAAGEAGGGNGPPNGRVSATSRKAPKASRAEGKTKPERAVKVKPTAKATSPSAAEAKAKPAKAKPAKAKPAKAKPAKATPAKAKPAKVAAPAPQPARTRPAAAHPPRVKKKPKP